MVVADYVVFGLLAGVLWAVSNVFKKVAVSGYLDRPLLVTVLAASVSALLSLPLFAINPTVLPGVLLILVLAAGMCYTGAIYFLFTALHGAEVSRVAPLTKLTAVFTTVLAATFLGEVFQPVTYLGIGLVVAGAMLVSTDSATNVLHIRFTPAFWNMVGATVLFAVSWVLVKHATATTDFLPVFVWSRFGAVLPIFGLLFVPAVRQDLATVFRAYREYRPDLVAVGEVANTAAILVHTFALSLGPVSLVATASATTPLFVLLFVTGLSVVTVPGLDEDLTPRQWLLKGCAAVLVIVGIYLIG